MTEGKSVRDVVAKNIRKYRKRAGLTQERLAELADISNTYIANIECGKTWVSDKTLEKVSSALRTEAWLLFVPSEASTRSPAESSALQEEFRRIDEAKEGLCAYIRRFFDGELKRLVVGLDGNG